MKKLSKFLKEKIIKNDKLYVLIRCIKSINDPNLSKLLKGYYEEASSQSAFIWIKRRGIQYPESHAVYYIVQEKTENKTAIKRSNVGFCAILHRTLVQLFFADYFDFTPVVEWGRESAYYDDEMDLVTKNVFEYYFNPVSPIPYDAVSECAMVVERSPNNWNLLMQRKAGESDYEAFESEIDKLAYVYKKYIHLNEETEKYIYDCISSIKKGNECVLAVHFRGTDFNLGLEDHPIAVAINKSLVKTKKLFETGKYDKIFLATDDSTAIEAFEEIFGENLIYYTDVWRTSGHCGPHNTSSGRPLHYYKLGLEVLRDIYTLANCDSLVCGLSQVSFAARYVNMSLGREFKELVILNDGINKR